MVDSYLKKELEQSNLSIPFPTINILVLVKSQKYNSFKRFASTNRTIVITFISELVFDALITNYINYYKI